MRRTRLATGPISFDWFAQLGETGDAADDPSIPWPENRKLVKLGTIILDELASDPVAMDQRLLFMPGNMPDGIVVADPMLRVRDEAYPISFGERQ